MAEEGPTLFDIFKSWPIYHVLVVMAIWQLRRLTHVAWLGSGWPQWVAGPDRAEDFDRELNSLHRRRFLGRSYFYTINLGIC